MSPVSPVFHTVVIVILTLQLFELFGRIRLVEAQNAAFYAIKLIKTFFNEAVVRVCFFLLSSPTKQGSCDVINEYDR